MLWELPKPKLASLSNSSFYASAQPISLASTKPKVVDLLARTSGY
jgi:hypothetical protein